MNFPFGTNGKFIILGVPILKHIRVLHYFWKRGRGAFIRAGCLLGLIRYLLPLVGALSLIVQFLSMHLKLLSQKLKYCVK